MKIFLSYSTPVRPDQEIILNEVKAFLSSVGVQVKIVNACLLDCSPIFPIMETIADCQGLIALAFTKYQTIDHGKIICTTSHWIDIELALALQKHLPCMALKEGDQQDSLLMSAQAPSCCVTEMRMLPETPGCIDVLDFKKRLLPQMADWISTQLP